MIGVNNLITLSNLNPAKVDIYICGRILSKNKEPPARRLHEAEAEAVVKLFCCTGVLHITLCTL